MWLRPLVQPVFDRTLYAHAEHGPVLRDLDVSALLAAGRDIIEEAPRTAKQLGEQLQPHFPDRNPASLAWAVRNQLPIVQVPPRAIWGRAGQPVITTIEAWLGRPLDAAASRDRLARRYLAAFGPASVADVQAWSGLTRMSEVVERLRPELRVFRDERGVELFDLPVAPRPDPDTPAPPRIVAEFDNLVLSHADRTRVLADEHRRAIFFSRNGQIPGTVLLDGSVAGTWRLDRAKALTTLVIDTFSPVRGTDAPR